MPAPPRSSALHGSSRIAGSSRRSCSVRLARHRHPRTWPVPRTTFLYVVSPSSATGPRAWRRPVAMPISPPKPNSPPSANWVEALWRTIAESTPAMNARGGGGVGGDDRVGVVRPVARRCGRSRRRRRRPARRRRPRRDIRCPSRRGVAAIRRGSSGSSAASARTSQPRVEQRAQQSGGVGIGAVDQQRLHRAADAGAAQLGVERRSRRAIAGSAAAST